MPKVHVRYWAGAARAAGHDAEDVDAESVGALRAQLAKRPALAPVMAVASVLVGGARADDDTTLACADEIDILPPFAGGAG